MRTLSMVMLSMVFGALTLNIAAANPIHIVAYGASQTNGKGVAPSQAYPAQLEVMLKAKGYEVEVTNAGENGITTNWELEAIDRRVPDGTDIVILQPGTNDNKRHKGGGDTVDNVRRMIQNLTGRGIPVILWTNQSIQREIPSSDRVVMAPEMGNIVGNNIQADGQHLTPEGYRLVAEQLLPQVIALIHQRTGEPDK